MVERFNRSIYSRGTVTYSDIDLSFTANPVTGDIVKKTDLDSIKQSLKNILFTDRGERPFQPDFHGGLNDLLFEPLDSITTDILKDQIIIAIQNYEPRISLISVDVRDNIDAHTLGITVKFNMQNVLEPQTIDLILTRRR